MKKIILSKMAYFSLIESILDLEENRAEFLDSYFPFPTKTREEMDSLLSNYISKMNDTFEKISVVESSLANDFPFVTIGSNITVTELDSQCNYLFHLITPSKLRGGAFDISILSPIGNALLLKETNAIVSIDAPGGKFSYQIISININCKDGRI